MFIDELSREEREIIIKYRQQTDGRKDSIKILLGIGDRRKILPFDRTGSSQTNHKRKE